MDHHKDDKDQSPAHPLDATAKTRHGLSLAALVLAVFVASVSAQPSSQPVVVHYAIEVLDSGQVVRRGTTGPNGIPAGDLILAPNTDYRAWMYRHDTGQAGFTEFTTPPSGSRFTIPKIRLGPPRTGDFDSDGLHDEAEFIVGTNPDAADSDSDGILDGAEIDQGLNPLDGLVARTGIFSTADTPGTAIDIFAVNDVVAVADGEAGVSVFNVFNGMDPVMIAQVDTPGLARAVTITGNFVVVADDTAGVAIIDITDPPEASIVHQVPFPASVWAVVAAADTAYVGMTNGVIAQIDLATGAVLEQLILPRRIEDLTLDGDYLYAYTQANQGDQQLVVIAIDTFTVVGRVASPGMISHNIEINARGRMAVGGGIAYLTHRDGYNTFDVSDPIDPRLIQHGVTVQIGWKQVVPNGSGLGLVALSPGLFPGAPHHVSLYDLSDPQVIDAFVTEFPTPGSARAISIYNGLAYVADHTAGLQAINYISFDAAGQAPTMSLSSNFSLDPPRAEEGQLMRLTATVDDDVQVRNVEFYVDGVKVATDGNFPFEHRFITPLVSQQPTFRLRARASDTGGNAVWSDELTVTLTPDATPPRVVRTTPVAGGILGSATTVAATFNEPILPQTLSGMGPSGGGGEGFDVFAPGPDGVSGNGDDVLVTGGVITFRGDSNTAFINFDAPLAPARYVAVMNTGVTDLAGNHLAQPVTWTFLVFSGEDADNDGVPDDVEPLLGLDPNDPDSDDDGILDGDEDFDTDGLSNAGEVVLNTNPTDADSDDDLTPDGQEDSDGRRTERWGRDPLRHRPPQSGTATAMTGPMVWRSWLALTPPIGGRSRR